MARPRIEGLKYFPLDCTWDKQMQALLMLHGNDGLSFMIGTWQDAYSNDAGICDLSGIRGVISPKTYRIPAENLQKIIDDAIKLGLIYEIEPQKYTSDGIQRRIVQIKLDREKWRNNAKNGLSRRKPTDNVEISGEKEKEKEKEKEIENEKEIEKEIKTKKQIQKTIGVAVPAHLVDIWPDYIEMRKRIRKPVTDRACCLLFATLDRLAPNDNTTQIKIVEQSIMNSWQGFFPLKQQNQQRSQYGRQNITTEELKEQSIRLMQTLPEIRKAEPNETGNFRLFDRISSETIRP